MSRTTKTEWHHPDGWHVTKRLERKARPAGAIKKAFEEDLAQETDLAEELDRAFLEREIWGYD